MNGKKLIIVVGVLGVISFAAAFILTGMVSPSPQETAEQDQAEPVSPEAAILAKADTLAPKGEYLEDMIRTVMQKDAEVRRRTKELDEREKRLKIAHDVLSKDAKTLDNLRVQLAAPLLRLKEMKREIDDSRIVIRTTEVENLKRMAKVYEKMSPDDGGATLTGLCKNSQVEDVAKLLHLMTEKGAAKILATMKDDKLTSELFKRLKSMGMEG